jgi:circadian clock protein KaiC
MPTDYQTPISEDRVSAMTRLPTFIPGLDEILHGGLFEGGVYIFEGSPGAGKTTLANQIAYEAYARTGKKTLYMTMLAESHSRMLQHMSGQSFFDPHAVSAAVIYISGYREMEEQGLKAVIDLMRSELSRHRAEIFVVDGLVVESLDKRPEESIRQFVHGLQSLASAMGCTGLLLTSGNGRSLNAEQTMVDGIFAFEDYIYQWRAERRIQVRKFRGSAVERGKHTFCITKHGLRFFPRLEGLPRADRPDQPQKHSSVSSGVQALDAVLEHGGFARGTSTLVMGASGSGKTLFASAFATQADLEDRCLLFACTETAAELRQIGDSFSLPIGALLDSGALEIRGAGQEDEGMDELGHRLLRLAEEIRAQRLVVDGLAIFADTVAFPERGYRFIGRLLRELKDLGVTSVFTVDAAALSAASGVCLTDGFLGWFDNVVELSRASDCHDISKRSLVIRKIRGGRAKAHRIDYPVGESKTVSSNNL